jgi:hypothetical protein
MRVSTSLVAMVVAYSIVSCVTTDAVSPNGGPFPKSWIPIVSNRFFPLVPGTIYKYRADTPDGTELDSVQVLQQLREVNGVPAVQVHDMVYIAGELTEDTYDWYAQDTYGNVWYLGEDTKEYDNGQVVSTAGSFEWGVNGAQPGIIMWADPLAQVGNAYRQEFAAGVAEDWGKVVATNETVTTPLATYTGCIKTEDWNALDGANAPHEFKWYCQDVGLVAEEDADGRLELVTLVQAPTLRGASSRP